MKIEIEISDEELKQVILDHLVRKELGRDWECSEEIRRGLKGALADISKEYRKELKEEIIKRSVDKIVNQDKNEAYTTAMASLLKKR